MQSRIGQKLAAVDSAWLRKIDQAKPSIRERMVLIILEELRKQGDVSWKELATKELKSPKRKNFIYEAELRKIFFADARRQNAPATERLAYAEKLLDTNNLSPLEWRSAIVQQVSAKLDLAGSDDLARKAVEQAARKFSEIAVWQTRHSMARMALSKGKYALAKEFLQKNATEISPAERSWAKSKMILARTEYKLGELASSASHYLQIFDNPGSPRERFKIYALLQWSVCVLAMGDTAAIISRKADFEKAIGRVKDYVLLLDTARGLLNAPPEFNALARQVLQRGKDAAQVAVAQAKSASLKSRIRFILARRLSDFGDHREIVGLWKNLSSEDQAANWCLAEDFWEFLGLVFVSMWELDQKTDAVALVNEFILDAATPEVGVAHLSIPLALRYMRGGHKAEAWSLLDRVIQVAPTHTLTAYAYYWYALAGMATGDSLAQKKYTSLIRQSLPPTTALGWQRKLLNRTACLEVEFDQSRLKIALKPNDSDEVVNATIIRTQADLDLTREP